MVNPTPNSNDPFHWLLKYGHRSLSQLTLQSLRPLRVDWSETHFVAWQRALLEEQLHFRLRCSARFPDPEQWLWTDRSLQQASDWQSAAAKAALFPVGTRVVDACCGAGADLVALSERHDVVAIDRDRKMLELASANMQAHSRQADYVQAELPAAVASSKDIGLHIDPDRRRGENRETRTTQADAFSPPLKDVMALGQAALACIIKLAPATDVELPQGVDWRRAWLGTSRECPQQLLLRGELAWTIPEGYCGALLVDYPDQPFTAVKDVRCAVADEPEEYLFEPHAVLYAAGLAAAWADEHGLSALPHSSSYFTGAAIAASPWAQSFEVVDHMSWDERRVHKWLKAHRIGAVEVKTRQVPLDANLLQRQLSQPEGEPISCLLYRVGKSIRIAMARRMVP